MNQFICKTWRIYGIALILLLVRNSKKVVLPFMQVSFSSIVTGYE